MPMYEFVCKSCGQKFEELKTVKDNTAKCPLCDSESEKIMSAASFVVSGSTNRSVDSVVGEDANKRWMAIEENKRNRNKELYKNKSDKEVKTLEQQRQSGLLQKQNEANTLINKAKQEAGITKKDEMSHLLKG